MKPSRPKKIAGAPGMVVLFFILAFALTWAFLIPAVAFASEPAQTLLIILAAFGPFLSAMVVIGGYQGKKALLTWLRKVFRVRIPVSLYLMGAFILPLVVGGLHFGFYRLLGGAPDFSEAEPWYLYLAYLIPTALLTGGNEEPGWRGFALPALLRWFHPLLASLILGVLHSFWHLPLMGHYDTNLGWYMFNLIPLTVIFKWFYLRSRQSIWPVMLFHASTNVISTFIPTPMVLLSGTGDYMFLRGAVYWLIALVLILWTKGRLGYPNEIQAQKDMILFEPGKPEVV